MLWQIWYQNIAWANDKRYSYTYDINNNQTEAISQNWSNTGGIYNWENESKINCTYVNNNLTDSLGQLWNGSAWMYNYKYSFLYDGSNNRIEEIFKSWDASGWFNRSKYLYAFDVNNNRTAWIKQSWANSTWVNGSRTLYEYAPITAINENFNYIKSYNLSINYPNPFNPSTKIIYSIPERSNAILKVFNLLGSEVATLVDEEKSIGTYEINWNAANLPSGVYFYRLQAGDFVHTRKMILLK